jgi:NAD(P)-dependent dehydrogenase (short-subunit alcohol dehydrogenase family)
MFIEDMKMAGVMVVTGAGRGIGAAVARVAARQGYAVCVNYSSSAAGADEVVAAIRRDGGKAIALQANISRQAEVEKLFRDVDGELGKVTVLVNNAGVIGGQCAIEHIDEARLQETFAINVFGSFYCAREALRRMSTRHGGQGGAIVNVSSAAARHGGLPKEAHYAASKGAIDSFTIALAKEAGRDGVRVNAVRPGLIETDIHAAHGGEATVAAIAPTIPLGRAGTADEVAEAIVWLASPSASYIHGAVLDVSGGR